MFIELGATKKIFFQKKTFGEYSKTVTSLCHVTQTSLTSAWQTFGEKTFGELFYPPTEIGHQDLLPLSGRIVTIKIQIVCIFTIMRTFNLMLIVGKVSKNFIQSVGRLKLKFEAIRLQRVQPNNQTSTAEICVMVTMRPFYYLVFFPIKVFLLNAPALFGGYSGVDIIDICASLTHINTKHLVFLSDMCNERISQEVHGYTVVAIAVLFVVFLFHLIPILKYVYEKQNEEKQRLHEMKVVDKQINTVEGFMKRDQRILLE